MVRPKVYRFGHLFVRLVGPSVRFRYDSKSLKLAPEISYTAPLVSAQQALKPREEGAADPEVDEVRI